MGVHPGVPPIRPQRVQHRTGRQAVAHTSEYVSERIARAGIHKGAVLLPTAERSITKLHAKPPKRFGSGEGQSVGLEQDENLCSPGAPR